jgi:hypothetical protein
MGSSGFTERAGKYTDTPWNYKPLRQGLVIKVVAPVMLAKQ